jgi:hypothetical protein
MLETYLQGIETLHSDAASFVFAYPSSLVVLAQVFEQFEPLDPFQKHMN